MAHKASLPADADIGLIGLAVMGQNLVLNMNDRGISVAVYNRTVEKTRDFIAGPAAGRPTIIATESIEELVSRLKRPRRVMLMVKAGEVVDQFIQAVLPYLEAGDIVIDGGNSHYPDSIRRTRELSDRGILFVGTGVSGGEEGARRGPSIMPGGNPAAWPYIRDIFQAIAARTPAGEACADWVGADGAGHYVKMIHNGIEYGDMQLIAEAYHVMKVGLGMSNAEMHQAFAQWNTTELDSYLVEITRDILDTRYDDGSAVLDSILDAAGQKGTGKWTGINALDAGIPVTLIVEAVFSRALSALWDERQKAAAVLEGPAGPSDNPGGGYAAIPGDRQALLTDLRQALLASKIVSYAQGFMLIREASETHGWEINYGNVALLWREGCIIRSAFLGHIKDAFDRNPQLPNLLLDRWFADVVQSCQAAWRRTVAAAVTAGIPVPAFSTALSFYDGYRSPRLPANMLQAQRDYFGAHTFERTDRPRGEFHHFNWTGTGGSATSGTYTV
jgi:6-phosphogluconate dehydrogenase